MSRTQSPPGKSSAHSLLAESAVIALGGAFGAVLRHAVGLGVAAAGAPSAGATTCVNVIGSFVLGAVLGRLGSPETHPLLHPFWVIGVLGSFTTFSTLAFDQRAMAAAHGELAAFAQIAISIGIGLIAFVAGTRLAEARA